MDSMEQYLQTQPEDKPLSEEVLIIEALHARVQANRMTEDDAQDFLNKLIGRRIATIDFDMLFYPTH